MPDGWYWSHDQEPSSDTGGGGFSGILQEFHIPWPACNQDAARQAANAWIALADGIDGINTECDSLVTSITAGNSGQAIDAFSAYWQKYGGESGVLPLSSEACRSLAKACNDFADKVSEVKTEIEHKAEELAAAVAVSAALLIFSFGTSVAVAEATAELVVT